VPSVGHSNGWRAITSCAGIRSNRHHCFRFAAPSIPAALLPIPSWRQFGTTASDLHRHPCPAWEPVEGFAERFRKDGPRLGGLGNVGNTAADLVRPSNRQRCFRFMPGAKSEAGLLPIWRRAGSLRSGTARSPRGAILAGFGRIWPRFRVFSPVLGPAGSAAAGELQPRTPRVRDAGRIPYNNVRRKMDTRGRISLARSRPPLSTQPLSAMCVRLASSVSFALAPRRR
jgi:hypothetical protein